MKSFNEFINEASLKKNKGIPDDYLKNVEDRQKRVSDEENAPMNFDIDNPNPEDAQKLMAMGQKIMGYSRIITDGEKDKKNDIEKLAERVLRSFYSNIVDENIIFDINIVKQGEVKFDIDDTTLAEIFDEYEDLDDEVKKEVDRAKITNNLIQGEGLNSMAILHTEESTNGLQELYGDKYEEMLKAYDDIMKLSKTNDWAMDEKSMKKIQSQMSSGFGGVVEVKWVKLDADGNEIDDSEINFDDIFDDDNEKTDESYTPKISVQAVNYLMCLHEGIKGIFELMAANSISDDTAIAETVKANAGAFANEMEDLRYGPYIAADIRDFINKSPNIDKYPNLREMVCGYLFMPQNVPTDEFLNLISGILMNTKAARKRIDEIVDEIVAMFDKHEMEQHIGSSDNDYEHDADEHEDNHDNQVDNTKSQYISKDDNKMDYSKMTPNELQSQLDSALDDENYDLAREISSYMKESFNFKKITLSNK